MLTTTAQSFTMISMTCAYVCARGCVCTCVWFTMIYKGLWFGARGKGEGVDECADFPCARCEMRRCGVWVGCTAQHPSSHLLALALACDCVSIACVCACVRVYACFSVYVCACVRLCVRVQV